VLQLPQFRHHHWRKFRAAIFVSLGLSSLFPIIHAVRLFGLEQTHKQCGLYWYLLEGLFYALGATVYAVSHFQLSSQTFNAIPIPSQTRIPERWRPGAFDIWGSSHQIFHAFVILGVAPHLAGLLVGFHYNHAHLRCWNELLFTEHRGDTKLRCKILVVVSWLLRVLKCCRAWWTHERGLREYYWI
jgi:adiponectin receptor